MNSCLSYLHNNMHMHMHIYMSNKRADLFDALLLLPRGAFDRVALISDES